MNTFILFAAGLAFLVGLAHSVFGEIMIFKRMRSGGIVPINGGKVIGEGHVRILWASWHVLTVFGWLVSSFLVWLAQPAARGVAPAWLLGAIAIAMLAGALFVLVGTKGRHPGWLGLLGVAVLTWLGQYA
ncbi:MAG: hypothetical protein JNM79_12290 [Burkholderiales bacterium]|nr:hypothetical protein [Burkholderiales bacterium]